MCKRPLLDSGFRVQRRPVGLVNDVLVTKGKGRDIEVLKLVLKERLVGVSWFHISEGQARIHTAENGHNFSRSSFSTAKEASWARDFQITIGSCFEDGSIN